MMLWIIAAVIILPVIVLWISAGRNMKALNRTADAVLDEIQAVYPLTACDTGSYRTIRIYGFMNFHVMQYRAEKLGNISVMKVNAG